jgi:hypothetical protein
VTSQKAYRVEFVGPLTEYAGTENVRGESQKKLPSAPDKSKINFSKPAKKKPLLEAAVLHSAILSDGFKNNNDGTSNC